MQQRGSYCRRVIASDNWKEKEEEGRRERGVEVAYSVMKRKETIMRMKLIGEHFRDNE